MADEGVNETGSARREESTPQPSAQRNRISLPIIVGVVAGILVAFVVARRFFADPLPPITAEAVSGAIQQWRNAKLNDYLVEVEVQSREKEVYRVEVRDREAIQAWRNGQPLKQSRGFETWSVPGMFDTIESDLNRDDGVQVTLQGTFHPELGVPMRYRRIEWGNNLEVNWRVTKLDAIDGEQTRSLLGTK